MDLTDHEILDKLEGVASESKKDRVRRETLEKQQRDKEREE